MPNMLLISLVIRLLILAFHDLGSP
uniref:Uncharacterized protein n=1 Tax=Arundo donax TaxID=35708 RepID=A0A0A9FFB7_ARUDO